ncbi:MAG: 23S rRNA (pseudouridine(1915)-N(3))-methyltransferase RlmH [Bacillota bacterium]|nr:23S rRNA (pseudouridine(1915)-N(3))-methyltransferase RlmH [Bacillota bacterium]
MKYRIISVGKIREKFYMNGIQEYLKRLGPYTKIEFVDGLEEKLGQNLSEKDIERLLRKEGEKILNLITPDEILVVLDIDGKQISSQDLAGQIERWNASGAPRVNLIVGASYGVSPEVKMRANERISFSKMTFPHQMAVMILTEQIYRGFKIIRGEPYNK